jgi:hypothetical protein
MEAPYAASYLGGTLNACYKPGVRRIRDAAELTGDDVWITVTVPGDFQGAQGDPSPGAEAIPQWTSGLCCVGLGRSMPKVELPRGRGVRGRWRVW